MSSSQRVGEAWALFNSIRLPHPGQQEVADALDELRVAAQSNRNEPMGGVQVIAPVGAGKTEAARMFAGT
jgi:Holliday junction resolvasome RuvABC ATP-dependent DNA helicase subunit